MNFTARLTQARHARRVRSQGVAISAIGSLELLLAHASNNCNPELKAIVFSCWPIRLLTTRSPEQASRDVPNFDQVKEQQRG
jgi:hypothetical protein